MLFVHVIIFFPLKETVVDNDNVFQLPSYFGKLFDRQYFIFLLPYALFLYFYFPSKVLLVRVSTQLKILVRVVSSTI